MAKPSKSDLRIEKFGFPPGTVLADKYQIISCLGAGWEGEVYFIKEKGTKIERAAKFFFPHRNKGNRASTFYAKKLHKLRDCPVLIQYHSQDKIRFKGVPVTFLVSDYVEGEILAEFLARQPGKRISVFQGLHLLHALATGMECIHNRQEYHGDLHSENVIIRRHGLGFDLKVLDLFQWKMERKKNIQEDVVDIIKIFHEAIGGNAQYKKHPPEVKAICCGLKRTLINKKFKNVSKLIKHLETMHWG